METTPESPKTKTTTGPWDCRIKPPTLKCYLIKACITLVLAIFVWAYPQEISILKDRDTQTPYDSVAEFCGIDCQLWLRVYFTVDVINDIILITFCKFTSHTARSETLSYGVITFLVVELVMYLFMASWVIYGFYE